MPRSTNWRRCAGLFGRRAGRGRGRGPVRAHRRVRPSRLHGRESLKLGAIADLPLDEARAFFDVRYWGAYTAAKYGAAHLRPGGSITFSSGIASARPPQAGWTLGSSICAAMEGLTRALAIELKPLRVNIVSPGFVRTPLWSDIPEADREAMYAAAGERLPVGRVGLPEDLAAAYLFLMNQPFATGQTLVVDGGGCWCEQAGRRKPPPSLTASGGGASGRNRRSR